MPLLDRRIRIERDMQTRDQQGRTQHDWQVFADVWAQRGTLGQVDFLSSGGIDIAESTSWTIRHRPDLLDIDLPLLRIRDENNHVWNPETITESDVRRRWLDISAIRDRQAELEAAPNGG